MTDKLWLTTAEAAEYAGVKASTIRTWIKTGKLKSHRISFKVQRVLREDIDALFNAAAGVQDAN